MMKRKQFMKSTALGVGALSVSLFTNAFNNTQEVKQSNFNLDPKIVKKGDGKKQIVLGDKQVIKLTGEDTNGLYTLIEQFNNPGMEIPLHIHKDEDELFHVLEGELEIQIGTEITVLKPGDMGFCPRGIPHSWKVIGHNEAKVMLSIFPAGLEYMFQELSRLPVGPPDFGKVTEICKKYSIQFV